jgi:vacuole morphology and inheritance protein 14
MSDLILDLTMTISSSNVEKKLRKKLRGEIPTEFAVNKEELFMKLYRTWCFNPVATLILCLLSRHYELAYNLIQKFTQLEIDFSTLK